MHPFVRTELGMTGVRFAVGKGSLKFNHLGWSFHCCQNMLAFPECWRKREANTGSVLGV